MMDAERLNRMSRSVKVGTGALMTIVDPRSFADGGVEWVLRYGNPEQVRFVAASLVGSYDYLLSGAINMTEATRRLRLLRAARRSGLPSPVPKDKP